MEILNFQQLSITAAAAGVTQVAAAVTLLMLLVAGANSDFVLGALQRLKWAFL